jgi:glycosyltransferase involved in cell wall biosynthesis
MSPLQVAIDGSAIPSRPAGAGRYVLELVGALAGRADIAVTVIARTDDRDRWAALTPAEGTPAEGATPVGVAGVAPVRRPLRLAWEQVRLPRLLPGLGVSLYHGPHYTMPERASVPKVVTIHDCTFFEHPEWHEPSKVWLFRRAIRVAAARADAVICVSATTAERLERWCSPRAPVHIIPHGVDHGRFTPAGPVTAADLARLGRSGIHPPYVAFVGTVEPRKDTPTLVRAFDAIGSRFPELTLVLAGGAGWGSAPAELESEIARATHGGRILRTGYLADDLVAPLLRQAAVVAYPSIDEGFGLPALEALACGAPLVTTSGTAMAEVAGAGALLVPPRDPMSLTAALEAILGGDPGQDDRTRAGLAIAAGYTWAASAAAHAAVYSGAAGEGD